MLRGALFTVQALGWALSILVAVTHAVETQVT